MAGAHAELSCTACRRLKRKCSKELPTCSLCKRVRRRCDYPTPTSSPDRQVDNAGPRAQSDSNRSPQIPGFNELASFASFGRKEDTAASPRPKRLTLNRTGRKFPTAWYLDSVGSRGMEMTIPTDLLWIDVATFDVTIDQARLIAESYFETAHSWLPTVSKPRVRRLLRSAPSLCGSADFAALLVAMDLLADSKVIPRSNSERANIEEPAAPGEVHSDVRAEDSIYQILKAVLSACEQKGQLTTSLLAAQVLTAAYEIGQGLYPAAYYSVGACARTCLTLGLHNRRYATQLRGNIDTWNETEERRRLWWTSIILDRVVSVGFMFRPLAVPSIPPNEIIPGDDELWDEGDLSVNPVLIMSIESQTKVSPFARTCQAAHLLGRVCDHVNEHSDPADIDFHFQEAVSIQRAGEALLEMVRNELSNSTSSYKFFSAMALCCSALLAVYGSHSCIEIEPVESSGRNRGIRLEMQQKGIDGYQRIARIISEFANDVLAAPLNKVSPFVLQCIYEAGCAFAWIFRENGSDHQMALLESIRTVLRAIEPRWAVAGEYLELLHDTENNYTGACTG